MATHSASNSLLHLLRWAGLALGLMFVSSCDKAEQSGATSASSDQPVVRSLGVVELRLPGSTGPAQNLYENSYALVIGASEYRNGWVRLPGVPHDIEAVTEVLVKQGFSVTPVPNPTRTDLDNALRNFVARYGQRPGNRLLIYFAGHGHTLTTAAGGKLGYIVPVDAPRPNKDLGGFKAMAYSMESIEVLSKQMDARHVIFLFDSCFSGTVFRTRAGVPDNISEKTSRPVRQFITSGDETQTVPDESIFRKQLVSALGSGDADLNHDGYITGSELGMFLEDQVTNYSRRTQTPRWGKIVDPNLDKGDFVFVSPNKQPPAIDPDQRALSEAMAAYMQYSRQGLERLQVLHKTNNRFASMMLEWTYRQGFTPFGAAKDVDTARYYEQDLEQTIKILERLAGIGDPIALSWLGNRYRDSTDRQEQQKGLGYFEAAASGGNAYANRVLASMYENGLGSLVKNDTKAMDLYVISAEAGDSEAMIQLSYMYNEKLAGLTKDEAKAVWWIRKGVEAGNSRAMFLMGGAYWLGKGGLSKDETKAVEWLRKAVEAGSADAMLTMGWAYWNGRGGLTKDKTKAVEWYRKAAEAGSADAMLTMGRAYWHGQGGLGKDETKAVEWFRKGAEAGNTDAMTQIGWAYRHGQGGLVKDETKAVEWYQKSANLGNEQAKKALSELPQR
ncbi:MAG: caspase family protein [Pseudomonadota bacterium]